MPAGIWISHDGRETPIPDLEDTHLTNIIKMLQKRAQEISAESIDWEKLSPDDYKTQLYTQCQFLFDSWSELVDEVRERELAVSFSLPIADKAQYDLPNGWYHAGGHLFYAIINGTCPIFFNNGMSPGLVNLNGFKYGWPELTSNLKLAFESQFASLSFYAKNTETAFRSLKVPANAKFYSPIQFDLDGKPFSPPSFTGGPSAALIASGCLLLAGLLGIRQARSKIKPRPVQAQMALVRSA